MQPMARVVPVAPPSSPTPHTIAVAGLYTVEASRELPRVDATRTLKSAWLAPRTLKRFNTILHRYGRILTITNGVAGVLSSAVAFYPTTVGRWIALTTTPLTLLPLAAVFLGLRYDMVVLVLRTYDFWYQGLTSVVCPLLFAAYTRDARAVAAAGMVVTLVVILLADANFRAARFVFGISVLSSVLCMADACAMMFGWVQDVHPLVIFRVFDRAVTAEAVIAHGFGVITIIHAHNAYARRQFMAASAQGRNGGSSQPLTTTVRCVLLRCRLRWRDRTTGSRQSVQRRPAKSSFDQHHVQLRCPGLRHVVDARRTLLAYVPCTRLIGDRGRVQGSSSRRRRRWVCMLLRVELRFSSAVGFAATAATFGAVALGRDPDDLLVRTLGLVSLVATARVWGYFVCCVHQRDVQRLLHVSFDFLFIFVQLALAHWCVCDLSGWDARALATAASLLWVHWALTIDAIPPLTRTRLALPVRRLAIIVEIALVVALVLLALDILVWRTQRFRDREMLDLLGRHGADRTDELANWSVCSFFLNRLVTLFAWLGRSLYRLTTYDDDELVVLRGAVEYDDYEMVKRARRSLASKTQLQQITAALSQHSQREDVLPASSGMATGSYNQ